MREEKGTELSTRAEDRDGKKKKIWAEFTCKRDMEQKSGARERQWLSCAVMKREDELFH